MRQVLRSSHAALALLLATLASPAVLAQAPAWRLDCVSHGTAAPEPLGDRAGHAVQVSEGTCTVVGGPMDGGVTTQQNIWEIDGSSWRLLISTSLTRRPDGRLLGVNTVGTLTLQMKDGRAAGWTASGKGTFALATGSAAAFSGKGFGWTAQTTAPGRFVIDVKVE